MAAVGEVLGDAVTAEVASAWDEVYWLFGAQLIAEEARLYQQAAVDPAEPARPYRVVRRIEETADVISLVLEPADGGELPRVVPGQYVLGLRQPAGRQPAAAPVHRVLDGSGEPAADHGAPGSGGERRPRRSGVVFPARTRFSSATSSSSSAPAGDFVLEPASTPLLLASAGRWHHHRAAGGRAQSPGRSPSAR